MQITTAVPSADTVFIKVMPGEVATKPKDTKEEDPIAAFKKFQSMTPAEKIRDSILKKMGLREEDLARMPLEKRAAIEKQIEEEIKKSVEAGLAEKGLVVNLEA